MDLPLSYVTTEANPDVFFCRERQGVVLLRVRTWLGPTCCPAGRIAARVAGANFAVEEIVPRKPELRQSELAF